MDRPIHHLHISHNTPCLPPPPSPKNCISIVFFPSWDQCSTPREIKKNRKVMQGLGGKQGVLWKMCNWRSSFLKLRDLFFKVQYLLI